jgi:hypothetical protein
MNRSFNADLSARGITKRSDNGAKIPNAIFKKILVTTLSTVLKPYAITQKRNVALSI